MARAMNRMLGRLEDAQGGLRTTLSEQRRFAADASHEMRTPLTALRGDIETMRVHELPAAEREAALADMATSVDRMDRLVQGLLGLARVDGDDRQAERVDLGEMIGEIATREEFGDVTAGVVVSGDRAALRGMLVNLIDNGRHHGGPCAWTCTPTTRRPCSRSTTTGRGSRRPTATGSSTASTGLPNGAARRARASACRSPAPPPSAGAARCG